jgi:hypothetical protein
MVKQRQTACQTDQKLRSEDCFEIAGAALNRQIAISISGILNLKTTIRSLVGMSANKLSADSINKAVEKVPCETSVRYQ